MLELRLLHSLNLDPHVDVLLKKIDGVRPPDF